MKKKEHIQISLLSEFIEWRNELGSANYLFRGVPNAEYRIQASAYRRLRKDAGNSELLQVNEDLITNARLRGHGDKDGRELGDLEILAELQHFGAATCLIDFTHNAQVALYFACQEDLRSEGKTQDVENSPDGKVYAVCNDHRFAKVKPSLLGKKISDYFPRFQPHGTDRQLYNWEPGYQNNRIIAQQSIFVFGGYELDEDYACVISKCSKGKILTELERVSGINEDRLFPDFHGFARLHREEVPYTKPSASEYFHRAMQAEQSGQNDEAILNYTKSIELDPGDPENYHWRALAKLKRGRDQNPNMYLGNDVLDDLNKMVEVGHGHGYEIRGKILFNMGRYRKAIADFDKFIELFPDTPFCYFRRAEAKYKLGRYREAIDDLDEHLQIDPELVSTYLLRGKAKEGLGDLERAKNDFQTTLTLECRSHNKSRVNKIRMELRRIEKRIREQT